MPRITISVDERDHLALRLLAIKQQKKMIAVMHDAVRFYLEETGACKLDVVSQADD